MKKTLIINAHPDSDSYCQALCQGYYEALQGRNAPVEILNLVDMNFSSNAHHPAVKTGLETDLQRAQQLIKEADRIVLVYPIWWGAMPALLKGFLDRVLTPGFAFNYLENHRAVGLLVGKSVEIYNTTDSPSWLQWWLLKGDKHQQKVNIWGFCGAKITRHKRFGQIFNSTTLQREKWLEEIKRFA